MNDLKFPVKDLQNRYGLRRTALYARFAAANIEPEKEGTRAYISGKQLEELDRLDSHIKTGGKLEEFKTTLQPKISTALATVDKDNFTEALTMIEAIARHFQQQRDPLENYKALIFAAEQNLILPSSKVTELLGTKPKGEQFERGSFRFTRAGKIGGQSGWRVEKI